MCGFYLFLVVLFLSFCCFSERCTVWVWGAFAGKSTAQKIRDCLNNFSLVNNHFHCTIVDFIIRCVSCLASCWHKTKCSKPINCQNIIFYPCAHTCWWAVNQMHLIRSAWKQWGVFIYLNNDRVWNRCYVF